VAVPEVLNATETKATAQILRGIASGLLGPKSFCGGWQTAMLGAAIHFLTAFSAASVFYAASRKLIFLRRRPVLSGVLYGIVVYLFMYWVVMPLSAYQKPPFSVSASQTFLSSPGRMCFFCIISQSGSCRISLDLAQTRSRPEGCSLVSSGTRSVNCGVRNPESFAVTDY
jgi:hypothetical protein